MAAAQEFQFDKVVGLDRRIKEGQREWEEAEKAFIFCQRLFS